MTNTQKAIITTLVLISVGALAWAWANYRPVQELEQKPVQAQPAQTPEEYITAHLSDLAPEKASLGGTFYVTKISSTKQADGAISGDVEYEDGHMAYAAHYILKIENGSYVVQSFKLK